MKLSTPLSHSALKVMFLAAGKLGMEVILADLSFLARSVLLAAKEFRS
jgi:hypothetical protein